MRAVKDHVARIAARARRTKAEQSEATTERLISVARRLFAERGYAQCATEDIVAAAEVTRGALYHHFRNKEALFEAVFLQIQAEIGARIEAAPAPPEGGLWAEVFAGCYAFLEAACEPDVRQIVLRDAPAVLGIAAWRLADEQNATFRLRCSLAELDAVNGGVRFDVEVMTVMLNGALNEAALWLTESADTASALARTRSAFSHLMQSLKTSACIAPEVDL
jgi:AcrR family transcriptional regulator